MTAAPARRFCVTGGAGFIGSHAADALVARGAAVTILDDLSTGSLRNLSGVEGRVRVVRGSILDDSAVDEALDGVDTVLHLAAYVSAAGSVREPLACHEVNTGGTLRLLERCRRRSVRRIVLASSAAVYGESVKSPKHESDPLMPCSVYAQSKAAGEHLLRVWSHCYGMETVSLRFFNVFGARQSAGSGYAAAIAAFMHAALTGQPLTIHGDGSQTRDFVHVSDVVACLLHASDWAGPARGEAFNVGTGGSTSIRELAGHISALAGAPDAPRFAPQRPGDVAHSRADVGAAVAAFGYRPGTTLLEGLRSAMNWYREELRNAAPPRDVH